MGCPKHNYSEVRTAYRTVRQCANVSVVVGKGDNGLNADGQQYRKLCFHIQSASIAMKLERMFMARMFPTFEFMIARSPRPIL